MSEITTPITETALRTAHPYRIYQSLVIGLLENMTRGSLRLELPDGTQRFFGAAESEVTAHIRVTNPVFFQKCVLFGDVGFGESYVEGYWETESIERVINWVLLNNENTPLLGPTSLRQRLFNLFRFCNRIVHSLRPNTLRTSRRNISDHYDLGNEFYRLWLDQTMTYSSALFTRPGQSLEEAQTAKYDALCRKLQLKPGDEVLEIGSGWGGFSIHAAKNYGCRLTTVTISEEQFKLAQNRFQQEGLSDRISIKMLDYRLIAGRFDKVASIEMMEALGDRYLETYFAKIHEVLKPDGLVGLQYITVPDSRHDDLRRGVDFIQKHIFPGSLLLSVGRVNKALNRTGDLFLHHLEDMGASYATTLHRWWETFNNKLDEVGAIGFDARFIRKWNYYLQYCEAAFASRNISVVQAIYTRPNNRHLHAAY